ncbi:MAG: acyl carrier protein [Anaerolineales bacterium]|nr:acyl carrier protein [Anaerolineales bacterium]
MSSETQTPLLDELRGLLAQTFQMDPADIDAEAQLGELPQWDSMAHMDLMLGLESQFGVEISAETIAELISLPAILAHIQAKQHG